MALTFPFHLVAAFIPLGRTGSYSSDGGVSLFSSDEYAPELLNLVPLELALVRGVFYLGCL